MEPEKIESFIDKKINNSFSENKSIDSIIDYLKENIIRFSKRESYVPVSQSYLIRNWNLINFKKRYNTYYILFSKKRIKDLLWCKEKVNNNIIKEDRIFSLLLLKEKLLKTKQNKQS